MRIERANQHPVIGCCLVLTDIGTTPNTYVQLWNKPFRARVTCQWSQVVRRASHRSRAQTETSGQSFTLPAAVHPEPWVIIITPREVRRRRCACARWPYRADAHVAREGGSDILLTALPNQNSALLTNGAHTAVRACWVSPESNDPYDQPASHAVILAHFGACAMEYGFKAYNSKR